MHKVEDLEGMLREVEPSPLILGSDAEASLRMYGERERVMLENVLFNGFLEKWPQLAMPVRAYLHNFPNTKDRFDALVMDLVMQCMDDHLAPAEDRVPFKNRRIAEGFLSYFPKWDRFHADLAVAMYETGVLLKDAEGAIGNPKFIHRLLRHVHPTKEEAVDYFMDHVDFECIFLENHISEHRTKPLTRVDSSSGRDVVRIVPLREALDELNSYWQRMHMSLIEKRYA